MKLVRAGAAWTTRAGQANFAGTVGQTLTVERFDINFKNGGKWTAKPAGQESAGRRSARPLHQAWQQRSGFVNAAGQQNL
jgi:hypothetical protein